MLDRDEMPDRIKRLPVDSRGYPVPKFASWNDGVPEFRLADTGYLRRALAARLCWVCGGVLGQYMAFVIGPMCAINRTTAEPPCHLDCAQYSVRRCPFMAFPHRTRNMDGLPADRVHPGGVAIERNPGVALIWVTKSYRLERAQAGHPGTLIRLGEAVSKSWWCRGRPATLQEVMASVESGLPALREVARVHDGPEGQRELEALISVNLDMIRRDPQWHSGC